MNEIENFIVVYRQEADELLVEIEEVILEIEDNPDDREAVNRLFRAVHTIKGSGAMLGLDKVVNFTHTLETILDKLRDGILPITKELIDLILKSKDHIKTIIESIANNDEIDVEYEGTLISGLNNFLPIADENIGGQETVFATEEVKGLTADRKELTYRIRFKPHKTIFLTGTDPAILLEELKEFGEYEITPQTRNIPLLDNFNPEECHIFWDVILTTRKDINEIRDVFIFVEDECDLTIDIIEEESDFDIKDNKKLGEILVERKDITSEEINNALQAQKPIGEILVKSNKIDSGAIESALAEQKQVEKIKEKRRHEKEVSSLRVASDKLDTLVDLVGELVTVQARLSQLSVNEEHSSLLSIAEEVERLTTELRDNTMSIRMMPIGITFNKFRRLVRDLSSELGKNIELITEGAETELDKTVIDRLDDPLIHLIRNSIDHGIEPPEKRIELGKPEKGTIRLSAAHKGAYVVITIEDDGAGLDPEVIRKKALEKGLISKEAGLTNKEIFELIFLPGFSTAGNITNVSGRGVGMDVVKKTIESLRGVIDVDSTQGKGSTITLKLPLTLAIINGLLVTIGDVYYVLPLTSVEECVELSQNDIDRMHGSNILNVRGEIIPYVRLRNHFNIEQDKPSLEHIVITDVHEKRVGFVVDNVIGGHQTVIKSLGPAFKHLKDISGATILGDGTVALILDVNGLI